MTLAIKCMAREKLKALRILWQQLGNLKAINNCRFDPTNTLYKCLDLDSTK